MNPTDKSIQAVWCELIAEELARLSTPSICMSSGARSGLLAVALARHPQLECVMHVDERASAFYALGLARATERPAVWVTTSGTAVANGLPAVVEASQDGIPMLLLTADRPPELRDTGANQTITQVGLFSPYTRWHADIPCPDAAISPAYILSVLDQANARACGPNPGPVHLNLMFREPLSAVAGNLDLEDYLNPVQRWLEGHAPWSRLVPARLEMAASERDALCERIMKASNAVLCVGRFQRQEEREAAYELAQQLDVPVIADIGSGLRLDASMLQLIPYADSVLLGTTDFAPDLILHVGGPVVSKRIQAWMDSQSAPVVRIKTHPRKEDPHHRADWVVEGELTAWVRDISRREVSSPPAADLHAWRQASTKVQAILEAHEQSRDDLDEVFVAAAVARLRPSRFGLFLGNSMPIRDMDMFAGVQEDPGPVVTNRGASGIDGCLSTACGWARGAQQPLIAVLGDLALLHDLTALDYVRRSPVPVIVVIINNNGGGIFSFLPAATEVEEELFEECFGTPHNMDFSAAAQQFGVAYACPQTRREFEQTLQSAITEERSLLIEVRADRAGNVEVHRQLQAQIVAVLQGEP